MPADPSSPARDAAGAPASAAPASGAAVRTRSAAPASGLRLGPLAASLALSGAVLAGIGYYTFDAAAFRQMLRHVSPGLLAAALGALVARVALGGWRLSFISQGRLSLREGVRGQLAWDFFSNVTPSAIGGGPAATLYIARQRGLTVGETSAFMLFAMLMDQLWFAFVIPILIAATFFVDLIPEAAGAVGRWTFVVYFVVMLGWAGLFAYATLFRPALLEALAERLFGWRPLRRFRGRVMEEMRTLSRRAQGLRAETPRFYAIGFLLTAGAWAARYLLVVLLVLSVYPAFDLLLGTLRTAALLMGGMAMPTPGGSGGLEGLYALLLGPLMPKALVAPTLLTWRFLGYYLFIALGGYLFAAFAQAHFGDGAAPTSDGVAPTSDGAATATAPEPAYPTAAAADDDAPSSDGLPSEDLPSDDTPTTPASHA